jgi:hypothetical protein
MTAVHHGLDSNHYLTNYQFLKASRQTTIKFNIFTLTNLLEPVVWNSDRDLPSIAAHLVDWLDLVPGLVLVTLQEMLHIIFEALR